MHPTHFSWLFLTYIPLYLATHFGLYLLFKKAGVAKAWLAFVPVACYWPWIQITGRPKSWMIWAIVPAAEYIIWFSLVIDLMESFGRYKFREQAAGILFPFAYYIYLGLNKDITYLGKSREEKFRKKMPVKSFKRDWADALFFALVVAYLIRTFSLEAYKIPTSSMEDSMLVGDFLFVSKMNYGARFPITPIAFPLVHQDINGAKAYSELIQLPYMRMPGFENLERNDPVVFNVPYDQLDPTPRPVDKMQNYVKRCVAVPGDKVQIIDGVVHINGKKGWESPGLQHRYLIKFKTTMDVPSAETLTKSYDIYDFHYFAESPRTMALSVCKEDLERLKNDFNISEIEQDLNPRIGHLENYVLQDGSVREFNAIINVKDSQQLADKDFDALGVFYHQILSSDLRTIKVRMKEEKIDIAEKLVSKINKIQRSKSARSNSREVFPEYPELYPWNKDNYGPFILPARGQKLEINASNFHFYEKAIKDYEGNADFELRGSTPYLKGQPIQSYTFQMDYYWMMGDNRDNSLDSRFFGYVPENHIVGKPLFVFFSIQYERDPYASDGNKFVKLRWNRLFRPIR